MSAIDQHYLRLQFLEKIYTKNGTDFQSFFWDILKVLYTDFEPVRPYGNIGDKKNDGFRKTLGIFYQIYAPLNPLEKEAESAQKMIGDFKGLYEGWNGGYPIKEFIFLFNDKNLGITPLLFEALTTLRKDYPSIKFDVSTPKNYEAEILNLKEEDLLKLGFHPDSRDSIKILGDFKQYLEVELDRGNGLGVLSLVERVRHSLETANNDSLKLEFEIIEYRALTLQLKIYEAIEKYKSLAIRYPNDPRPLLLLSEIYLDLDEPEEHLSLIKRAGEIDNDFWLLKLEYLIRAFLLGEPVELAVIDENAFPQDARIKSSFYRLYAQLLERDGDERKAEEFIEKAIVLNKDKFSNYEVKLNQLDKRKATRATKEAAKEFIHYFNIVKDTAAEFKNSSIKTKISFAFKSLLLALEASNPREVNKKGKALLSMITKTPLIAMTDAMLSIILKNTQLPLNELEELLTYLKLQQKKLSKELIQGLIIQFCVQESLLSKGKRFFIELKEESVCKFIEDIELKKNKEVLDFLNQDSEFIFFFSLSAKEIPELRECVIMSLPENGMIEKNKVLLKYYEDTGEINEAYRILNLIDLTTANPIECEIFYKVAGAKNDYSLKTQILERWQQIENNKDRVSKNDILLTECYFYTQRFKEVIELGKEILTSDENISSENKNVLLAFILQSYLKRGDYPGGIVFINEHSKDLNTHQLKFLETEFYINTSDGPKALETMIQGLSILKPSEEDYAHHHFQMTLIWNLLDKDAVTSLGKIVDNTFVKFKDIKSWYFIGAGEPLDAIQITPDDPRYVHFIGKSVKENVDLPEDKYSSTPPQRIIEQIYTLEDYICWQIPTCFNELVKIGMPGVQVIEVPQIADETDFTNLKNFLADQQRPQEDFFNLYCSQNMPLAFLAISEGSLITAIGKIQNEGIGYIKGSPGGVEEITNQRNLVSEALDGKEVIIDATSALFLSEVDLFEKVLKLLPSLKVPNSVLNFLLEVAQKFEVSPGQAGSMGMNKGGLFFNKVSKESFAKVRNNLIKTTELIESNKARVLHTQDGLIHDSLSEKKVAPELRDACILAQKNQAIVLTDDFLYLQANNIQTKKDVPAHFSSFILVRILFEQGHISFEDYSDYFSYLSSYRYHFLTLNPIDLEKAVFGTGEGAEPRPENLRKFNLKLTLAKEYGVEFRLSFTLVTQFLGRIISNDSITVKVTEAVFTELYLGFFQQYPSSANLALETYTEVITKAINSKLITADSIKKTKLDSIKKKLEEISLF